MRVAGFGFRAGAGTASLRAALDAAQSIAGNGPLGALATASDKAAALAPLATALALALMEIPPDHIATEPGAAPNPRVPARYGHRSLAEAACLVAAGPRSRLIVPATPGPDGQATCAIAESPGP